jgi:hypothetical protein
MLRKLCLIMATNAPGMIAPLQQSLVSLAINFIFMIIVIWHKPYAYVRSGIFKDDKVYGLFNIMEIWCLACVCVGDVCAIIGVFERNEMELAGTLFAGLNIFTFLCLQCGFSCDRARAKQLLRQREKKKEGKKRAKKKSKKAKDDSVNESGIELEEANADDFAHENPIHTREKSASVSDRVKSFGSSISDLTMATAFSMKALSFHRQKSDHQSHSDRTHWLTAFDEGNNTLSELTCPEIASEFMEIGLDMYVEKVLEEHIDGEHLLNLVLMRDEGVLDECLLNVLEMGSAEHRDMAKDWIASHLSDSGGTVMRHTPNESSRNAWESEANRESNASSARESASSGI